jgi:hypothetical protein
LAVILHWFREFLLLPTFVPERIRIFSPQLLVAGAIIKF